MKEETPEPLPTVVIAEASKADIPAEVSEREVIIPLGDRRYWIRGLDKIWTMT